ncbi:type VII secretion protein EccCb [Dactylosporangium sp. NPDC051541]|uniref:type VII secretion protein EccCb n=1 Tax=Dactylosporangium sp. NPDC051541 TaxID=3363977 RepID=UPI003790A42C
MGQRLAVLVANSGYLHLPKLVAPVDEAAELRVILLNPEIGAFDRVELLRDENKTTVERAIADALGAAGPGDLVVIYFSGHGQLSSRGRLFLAVRDSEPTQLAATAISASWLRELLEESDAASTVILLDCCYSGAYVLAGKAAEVNVNQELKAGSGRYVLTATNAVEQAEDAGSSRDRSAFTEVLVAGLSTGAADLIGRGFVTPEDLGRYVRAELPKHTAWQTPTTHGSVEDDVFLARVPGIRYRADADSSTVRLADLLGELAATGDVSLCAVEWRGRGPLLVPIGRAFRPGLPPGEVVALDLAGQDGNIVLVGGSGSGKSTLLQTFITSTVLTHTPDEVAFYCLESGGNRLGSLRELRHIRHVAGDDEHDQVNAILAEVRECIASRKRMFRAMNIESASRLRRLRAQLGAGGPHPDVFLVIDRWREFNERFPAFAAEVLEIANSGLDYATHVIISARRWEDLPEDIIELAHTRIELRAGGAAPGQSPTERRLRLPHGRPGWAVRDGQVFRIALPDIRADPPPERSAAGSGHDDGARDLLLRVVQAWQWQERAGPDTPPSSRTPLAEPEKVLRVLGDDTAQRTPQPSARPPSAAAHPGLAQPVSLLRLLGIERLEHIGRSRPRRAGHVRLRVPLGVGIDGAVVELDLNEAAHGGMGPHGLVVGAPGAGKSELLRSIVAGLAAEHSSEDVNFVLIDYTGGATFAPMAALPHTSAVITNLRHDLSGIDRMQEALRGELVRRQELLRSAGNYVNRHEYEQARLAGEPLGPLPSLMVICDEFSELLQDKPDFLDLFLQIGRLGRSLGVHLMLASQRLQEGKLRGLDTNLSYRIGLRTFSPLESRIVLGVPDAYELPAAPGNGYLKVDASTMLRFRAAYVSEPLDRDLQTALGLQPTADTASWSALDLLVAQLHGQQRPAHQIWLPPLDVSPSLDKLLQTTIPQSAPGRLPGVPVGLVDRPFEQRRDVLLLPLDGGGGNVAIVGSPQSGKSTLVRSLLLSLAMLRTPYETQFFCLDFGGGGLQSLDGLPHVSGVARRHEVEKVRRTVAEVNAVLDEREVRFARLKIDSMADYQRRRQTGEVTDDQFGDVFLVIDGWDALRQEYEELALTATAVAARGLNFGVHVIVAATRWADIRASLRDLLGTRLELRLGDPSESEIDRRAALNVPAMRPGRGLTADRLHFVAALPRLDGKDSADDLREATADAAAHIAAAWPHPLAPKVRLLPRLLPVADLARITDREQPGIPIGINEAQLAPVYLNFDAEPHLIVFGDAESGKTNLLRLIGHQIMDRYTSDEAKLVVGDYRRGLLGAFPAEYQLVYSPSGPALTDTLASVRQAIDNRLPGADVTPEQLRRRNWWRGPKVFVLIDDYDLVSAPGGNPVAALIDLLPQARDVGLHLIVARRTGGAARALYEPVIQRLREIDAPGLQMSGSREEGQLFGTLKPGPQPPGRGFLVRRNDQPQLIQVAWDEPPSPPAGG